MTCRSGEATRQTLKSTIRRPSYGITEQREYFSCPTNTQPQEIELMPQPSDVTLFIDPTSANPAAKGSLSQNITRAVAGNTWYLSVRFVTEEVDPASCYIKFGTYLELLTLRDYAQVPASGTVYASGTFQTTPVMFYMTYSCDNNDPARNVSATFDDLSLIYYYNPQA
jgi:hypothetical protein